MNRRTSAVITTACVGMAAGAAAYMMASDSKTMKKRTKHMKKSTGKALRQMGDFIDNVSHMMQ